MLPTRSRYPTKAGGIQTVRRTVYILGIYKGENIYIASYLLALSHSRTAVNETHQSAE